MNETIVTVTGRVATPVEFRTTQSGVPAARFRIAATERRYDQEKGGWGDGHTNWYTVWTWRQLAANVTASVAVGEPVVVQGKLRLREWEYEGKRHTEARLDALAVGHDLSFGTTAFHRVTRARPEPTGPEAAGMDAVSVGAMSADAVSAEAAPAEAPSAEAAPGEAPSGTKTDADVGASDGGPASGAAEDATVAEAKTPVGAAA
ncbi:single-stranded DNA-binding protein [Streptomyces sp. A7024]|uniref:Single-stranded DNA-binding protein n=1 Tax=Streptomyces coryli TaxID=1128680 RepID=A0A6G4U8H8_9ACTN|nr:single-stranded DNA-binding protein [Streptomyces coryli]NGN68030.1 single-stranded DNA-binding protein [Streptomyces coryli]